MERPHRQLTVAALCILAVGAAGLWANSDVHRGAGTTAFKDLLSLGHDARSQAMGKVQIGMPNEVFGALGNPAAIGYMDKMGVMVTYQPVILDIRSGAMAFARPSGSRGTWALNLLYLSMGGIEEVDENNVLTGNAFNPFSMAGGFSWARTVANSPLSVGGTVKAIYGNLGKGAESADAFALDLGAQHRIQGSTLVLGILMRNLGLLRSGYSEDTGDALLPASFGAGVSYAPRHASFLRMALDLDKPIDDYLNYRLGLEIAILKQYLLVRTGANLSHRDIVEGFRTLGGGQDDEYQKSNWSVFSLGVGAAAPIGSGLLRFDAGLVLRVAHLPPALSMTLSAGF